MRTFDEYKEYIEEHLLDPFPESEKHAEVLFDSMLYSLKAGGKRLRPVLVLAACELAGGRIEDASVYASAMEYIHTYSLIHDDLPAMDNDDLRRGKKTNHKVFGAGIATLAGDGLLNTAFEIMAKDIAERVDRGEDASRFVMAEYEIAKAAGVHGMVAGQTADIKAESGEGDEDLIHYIELNKTGALIKASIRAGLLIGGADKEMLERMTVYAEDIGIAFQIDDDVLDVESTTSELGKPVGSDEDNNKLTYVSLNGIESAESELHRLTCEAIEADSVYDNSGFFTDLARNLEKRTK